MYNKVMVPVDGSEQSDCAVDHGLEIAERFESTIHVVHVASDQGTQRSPKTVGELAPEPSKRDDVRQHQNKEGLQLTNAVAERAQEAGVNTETVVLSGNPADTITEYAEEKDIDVVIIGAKGRSAVGKFLLGDVAGKVARYSPTPVMIVRAE